LEREILFEGEDAPLGLALSDAAGHFLEVNPALCAILARSEEELRGIGYADVLHPEDRPTEDLNLAELLAGDGS
jgi:PAS domain S-box-containing protein